MSYLIHYGVKGMKWGVRRYQNYDGTRIGAKKRSKRKTEKQIRKVTAFRDKKASNAKKWSESNKREAESAREDLEDLRLHGANSKTYRLHLEEMRNERAERWYEEHPDSNKSYTSSGQRYLDEIEFKFMEQTYLNDLIADREYDFNSYTKEAKRWEEVNKKLMEMEINELTSKRDVRKLRDSTYYSVP